MTLNEALIRVRQLIRDTKKVDYSDSELIGYINEAITYLFVEKVKVGDGRIVKEMTVKDGDPVPSNFFKTAGDYPMYIVNGNFKLYDSADLTFRYYASYLPISALSDTMPFNEPLNNIACRVASIYALNRNEFTVTQDMNLVGQVMGSVSEAIKQ